KNRLFSGRFVALSEFTVRRYKPNEQKGEIAEKKRLRIMRHLHLIYTDLPLALSTNFEGVARYAGELKQAAVEALAEEAILVAVTQVYHAV
ncbi:MAG: hypothetical protein H0W99_04040, partial [Acidobacteria bacterium]|nr:hypothetical protein [Acidobacteriota bacterium]